jgi:hypothetical protein
VNGRRVRWVSGSRGIMMCASLSKGEKKKVIIEKLGRRREKYSYSMLYMEKENSAFLQNFVQLREK